MRKRRFGRLAALVMALAFVLAMLLASRLAKQLVAPINAIDPGHAEEAETYEELAPLLGLADGIVDIVETGTTLRENGLEVKETVADISARMIVNTASMKLRKAQIEELVRRLEIARDAEE